MSGYYFPKEVGFDGKFFLQWGAGTKRVRLFFYFFHQLLELGKSSGYTFRYFNKDKSFTKEHLIHELAAVPDAKFYIPDDINPKYLSRDLLFSVSLFFFIIYSSIQILETVAPQRYVYLYTQYKEKLASRGMKKWSNYKVYVKPEIALRLKEFVPTNE